MILEALPHFTVALTNLLSDLGLQGSEPAEGNSSPYVGVGMLYPTSEEEME